MERCFNLSDVDESVIRHTLRDVELEIERHVRMAGSPRKGAEEEEEPIGFAVEVMVGISWVLLLLMLDSWKLEIPNVVS